MAELIFPLSFKRQYSGSLDTDLVFETIVDRDTYLTNPLRYAGMIVSCKELEGKIFVLNNAMDTWLSQESADSCKVKISADDTTEYFLESKIVGTTNKISITKQGTGENENLKVNISTDVFDKTVDNTENITETLNKVFVSPTEKTAIVHTNRTDLDLVSGTNTGDETKDSILTKIGYTPINSDITTYTTKETLASADYILIADSEAENGLKKVTKDVLGLPDLSLYALKSKMFYPDNQYGGIVSDNLNTLTVSGFYTCYGTAIGVPSVDYSWFVYHHNSNVDTTSAYQRAVAYSDTTIVYERTKTSNLWSDWTRFDVNNITSLINNKQSLPIVRDYTLSSANWVGTEEPYTYTLEVLNTDSNDIIDVSTQNSATYTQVQDIANAKIYQIIQSENTLTFKAGVLPTSDLLISVVIWKG